MKRNILIIAAAVLVVAATAWAKTGDMDPLLVGNGMYKLKYENERVRVMEVTFEPGQKIGMHSHPDHSVYFIEGGQVKITTSDGKENVVDAKTGDAMWLTAQTHSGENVGKTRVRILVTELKEPATAKPAEAAEKK